MVVQAFHHHFTYEKDQRRLDNRKEQAAWQQQFVSANGYVADGLLHLPPAALAVPGLEAATHLFINDFQEPESYLFSHFAKHHVFNLRQGAPEYDAFRLKVLDGGGVELHLNWSFFEFFGEKDQYKLAELHADYTIEIRRNRVTNFSASGRRAKVYTEAFTILQMLGTYTEAVILREPITKPLPKPDKVVDVMKHLY